MNKAQFVDTIGDCVTKGMLYYLLERADKNGCFLEDETVLLEYLKPRTIVKVRKIKPAPKGENLGRRCRK